MNVWSQNLGEQKIGSGATAYKLGGDRAVRAMAPAPLHVQLNK